MNKQYTLPKLGISPFYKNVKKIPRKLRKKIKKYCSVHYNTLTNEERLWDYLGYKNPKYKQFLIDQMILNENNRRIY